MATQHCVCTRTMQASTRHLRFCFQQGVIYAAPSGDAKLLHSMQWGAPARGATRLQVLCCHKQAEAPVHGLGHVVRLVAVHRDAHQRHAVVGRLRAATAPPWLARRARAEGASLRRAMAAVHADERACAEQSSGLHILAERADALDLKRRGESPERALRRTAPTGTSAAGKEGMGLPFSPLTDASNRSR
jgi:hypothetical protein